MPFEIAATLGTVRALANVAKEAGKIELYQQVIDLQQTILEAIAENTRLVGENAALTRRVAQVERELERVSEESARRKSLTFIDEMYWTIEDAGNRDGPFCPKCLDADGKVVRMTDRKNGFTCCVNCHYCVGESQHRGAHERGFY